LAPKKPVPKKLWELHGVLMVSTSYVIIYALTPYSSGQSVAVAHDPPRITLHSIQDGQEERVLPSETASNTLRRSYRITGLWWFQEEHKVTTSSIPDMFGRNNAIVRASNFQKWSKDNRFNVTFRQGRPIRYLRLCHCLITCKKTVKNSRSSHFHAN
jgi:hypothetical protein